MAKEKTPNREELVRQLAEIALYMEVVGENDFKVRAFRLGAEAIGSSEAPLSDIASGKAKVSGVGDSLKKAVGEFLASGEVKALSDLIDLIPNGVLALLKVPGLGPKKAVTIQKELGINSVAELENACRQGRLTVLKGFGPAVQEKILRGIAQLREAEGRFRLDEAIARAEALEHELRAHLGKKAAIIRVGGIGRSAEIVDSIELCFSGEIDDIVKAVAALSWQGGGVNQVREQPFKTQVMGLTGKLADGTQVTLWLTEERPDEQTLRWLCADQSMRDEMENSPRSFDGYEASWIETEWFDAGRKPARDAYRVARDGHVRGIFHCHTNFSDGRATLEQMVRGAEERGYEYIGIADHSIAASYAGGLSVERVKEQRAAIAELQKKTKIRIFHGIESDILQDGALDYDEQTLAAFDFVVGSIHTRFKLDHDAMTARLTTALSNPYITFWGHPTGRLLLGREGYQFDWESVLDTAHEAGVAIEINSNPQRLDVDWRLGGELEKRGVHVVINPDAHDVKGLDDTRFGELVAEKAMLPRGLILNLMGVAEIEKFLWERKQQRRH